MSVDTKGRDISIRKQILNSIASIHIPVYVDNLEPILYELFGSPGEVIEDTEAFAPPVLCVMLSTLRIEANLSFTSKHLLN